jgi:hypothetical protein
VSFNLGDYVTVNERLIMALKAHPKLRVQETSAVVEQYGNQTVLICTVTVWRDEQDPLPVIGSAQESLPGTTPFTRGSERMVGFTSALGRCLGYMGFGIDKSIASSNEVEARQPAKPERAQGTHREQIEQIVERDRLERKQKQLTGQMSQPQRKMLKIQATKCGLADDAALLVVCAETLGRDIKSIDHLSKQEASQVIEELLGRVAAEQSRLQQVEDPF